MQCSMGPGNQLYHPQCVASFYGSKWLLELQLRLYQLSGRMKERAKCMGLSPKVLPRACTCHVLHLIGRIKSHGSLTKREAWKCSPYSRTIICLANIRKRVSLIKEGGEKNWQSWLHGHSAETLRIPCWNSLHLIQVNWRL